MTSSIKHLRAFAALAVAICLISVIPFDNVSADTSDAEYWSYTLNYDSSQMSVSNGRPLSYGEGMEGMTPVDNTSTSPDTVTDTGSWNYGSGNAFVDSTFYGVFTDDGRLYKVLSPDNLTKYLDGTDASTDIKTMNVLWCVPTIYWKSTSTTLTITNNPNAGGVAYAHTIDGHVYDYLGYGVYEGTTQNGKLMSISDSNPTASQTRAIFRTQAAATFGDEFGKSMLWNFYQWELYRYIVYYSIESFDSQSEIGNGQFSGVARTGTTNTMGPFAGAINSYRNFGVKAYIENVWGSLSEWVDDYVQYQRKYYAGQNSVPSDTTSGKTSFANVIDTGFGYVSQISTNANCWGWGTAFTGSETSGTTDYQWNGRTSSVYFALSVGASWNNAVYYGGVGYTDSLRTTSISSDVIGSRLTYVFDSDALPAHIVTFSTGSGSAIPSQIIESGQTALTPSNPTLEGYVFDCWSTSPTSRIPYDFNTPVTQDLTLYAVWVETLVFTTTPTSQGTVSAVPNMAGTILCDAAGSRDYTSLLWDLGDGTLSTDNYVTHYYSEPGTYTVTLTTYNSQGADVTTFTVEVPEAPGGEDGDDLLLWVAIGLLALLITVVILSRIL